MSHQMPKLQLQTVPGQLVRGRNAPAKTALAGSVLLLAASLAGCGTDRIVTGSIVEDDMRARHPIVLTNAPTNLDIFVAGNQSGLDSVSKGQLRQFAKNYQSGGQSQISLMVPVNGTVHENAHRAVDNIRHELIAGGARGFIKVSSYPVADPSLASPYRLSYLEFKAKVATKCGEWPADLGSGGSLESWNNKPYWNLGCSYQNALAAQIADPRDLAGPRAETPPDTAARTRAITKVREGQDPTTTWSTTLN